MVVSEKGKRTERTKRQGIHVILIRVASQNLNPRLLAHYFPLFTSHWLIAYQDLGVVEEPDRSAMMLVRDGSQFLSPPSPQDWLLLGTFTIQHLCLPRTNHHVLINKKALHSGM